MCYVSHIYAKYTNFPTYMRVAFAEHYHVKFYLSRNFPKFDSIQFFKSHRQEKLQKGCYEMYNKKIKTNASKEEKIVIYNIRVI